MMSRRDHLEQAMAFAHGRMATNPEAIIGQRLLREVLCMLKQRVARHVDDLDMLRDTGWYSNKGALTVEREYSETIERRKQSLEQELKFLNDMTGRGR